MLRAKTCNKSSIPGFKNAVATFCEVSVSKMVLLLSNRVNFAADPSCLQQVAETCISKSIFLNNTVKSDLKKVQNKFCRFVQSQSFKKVFNYFKK